MHLFQVAQHAKDLDRAVTFYTDLFNTAPVAQFDSAGLAFFDLQGTRFMLDTNAASALVYLQVPDLDQAIARLRAEGVKIEQDPHVIFTHGDDRLGPTGMTEWQAFIRDSEGNLVGLASMVPAGTDPIIE